MSTYPPNTSAPGEAGYRVRPESTPRGLSRYVALTKPPQTALLLVTGLSAYSLSSTDGPNWQEMLLAGIALLGAIAGCTVLNMVIDRDIDAQMGRTSRRPLPTGAVTKGSAVAFGLALSVPGLALAWALTPLFGALVSLGFLVDLLVYTVWLKRRTPLSILFGGISGGMPALAGRALAIARVDLIGVLLATGVLLWIPSHILTLATHYAKEYRLAGVPIWPNVYGPRATRRTVAAATLGATCALGTAGWLLGLHPWAMTALGVMGAILSAMALAAMFRPSERLNWRLFKAASVYMLGAFVCLAFGSVL